MDIQQRLHKLLFDIADDVVVISKEEKTKAQQVSTVPTRLLHPLLHQHNLPPVSSLHPSSTSCIVQPRVLKQRKNDCCGYYALYNVLTAASAITAQTDDEALKFIHQLGDRTRFWVTYNNYIQHLHKRADSNTSTTYPWTRDHIDKGILERPYIQFLMNSKLIPSNIDITVLSDFSWMGMKHNVLPIEDLQKLSQVFANYNIKPPFKPKSESAEENGADLQATEKNIESANQPSNKLHAFLVGQTCHWISFICNKVGETTEVLVFDSRNYNLLTSPHEEFIRIVNKSKKQIPEWKKEIYLCSLKDPKSTADLFHDCVMGIRDVITSLLEHNMEGFLSSFEEHVEKSEMKDMWLVPLIAWLEMYWPPPVVESNIIRVLKLLGVSKLSATTREKFLRMVKLIRESINFGDCDIPVVQRFEAVVLWLEVAFSVPSKV